MNTRTLVYVTDLSFDTTPYALEQLGGYDGVVDTQLTYNGLEGIVKSLLRLSEKARQWCEAACPWEYSANDLEAVKRQIAAEQSRYDALQQKAEARIAELERVALVNSSIATVIEDPEARATTRMVQAVRQRLIKVREFAKSAYNRALPYFEDFKDKS